MMNRITDREWVSFVRAVFNIVILSAFIVLAAAGFLFAQIPI